MRECPIINNGTPTYNTTVNTTCTTDPAPSIFTTNNKNQKSNSKELTEEQLTKKISTISKTLNNYNIGKSMKKADNIEKTLNRSKVPNFSTVGSFVHMQVKSLSNDINSLIEKFSTSASNCKTEDELNKLQKETEEKLQQTQHKAKVYIQRGELAEKLSSKLESVFNDPKKAELAEKLDLSKIIGSLTKNVEDVDMKDIETKDDKEKKSVTAEKFEEALKNDEASQVVTSILKYLNKGEKDKILDDYMKEGNVNASEGASDLSSTTKVDAQKNSESNSSIGAELKALDKKYGGEEETRIAKNIINDFSGSKYPELQNLGKNIVENINSNLASRGLILLKLNNKVAECKSETEAKNLISEAENKLSKLKDYCDNIISNSSKAYELKEKLETDPKLAEKLKRNNQLAALNSLTVTQVDEESATEPDMTFSDITDNILNNIKNNQNEANNTANPFQQTTSLNNPFQKKLEDFT